MGAIPEVRTASVASLRAIVAGREARAADPGGERAEVAQSAA
jgi:hypothetical protein